MKNKNDFWNTFIPEVNWDYKIPKPVRLDIIDWVCATLFAVSCGIVLGLYTIYH